jgi:hypothetical protein
MSFEAQLTQAFETLTERLRGEIDQEVQRRAAEIAAATPVGRAPIETSVAPTQPAHDGAAFERLADGFDAIDRARSLTAILDALLTSAREDDAHADIWLIRGGRPHRWRVNGSDDAGDDTPPTEHGIPLTIGGQTVAVLNANDERRTANVVLLSRYASRSLEALTAFTTARALTEPRKVDSGLGTADSDASEEDTSARRYARLLVSEIKLYHESAVIEGRRDRDLAARLGGEITRARVMYEQRVPPHVRARADYFGVELVRTLCNGDASLLEVRA